MIEEEQKKKGSCRNRCASEPQPTETLPREDIDGSHLTDYIQLGRATPWADKVDLSQFLCMVFVLTLSFIKVGLMEQGFLFLTLDGLP